LLVIKPLFHKEITFCPWPIAGIFVLKNRPGRILLRQAEADLNTKPGDGPWSRDTDQRLISISFEIGLDRKFLIDCVTDVWTKLDV
jgi:hypothetical protein